MSRGLIEQENFCVYPWFHLQVKPNGIIKPCCRFDVNELGEFSKGDDSLDLKKGESWQTLRKKMNKGEAPRGCYKCVEDERIGMESMRLDLNAAKKQFNYQGEAVRLENLEVGFGNTCNLACRSCTSMLSTKWYDDDVYLQSQFSADRGVSKAKSVQAEIDWHDENIYKDLTYVKFTGGEPFLEKNFKVFLEELIKHSREKITYLRICTNASFVPRKSILELLEKFDNVELSISIDAYGLQNEYLRYPSRWEETEKTLMFWKEKLRVNKNWKMVLCATISIYSIESFPALESWWDEFSANVEGCRNKIILQPVYNPSYLSPSILPIEIVGALKSNSSSKILDYFSGKNANDENIGLFNEFTHLLDKRRDQSFSERFPLLAKEINQLI